MAELLAMLTTRADPHWLKGGQGSPGQGSPGQGSPGHGSPGQQGEGLLSNDKDAAHLFLEGNQLVVI